MPQLHNMVFSTGFSEEDGKRKYSSALNNKDDK